MVDRGEARYHLTLQKDIALIQLPIVAAFGDRSCHACAHHSSHQFGLILIGSHGANGLVVAALWALHLNEGHCGVEDMRLIENILFGVCL